MEENVLDKKIMVNWEVYIKWDTLLKFMKNIFEDINDGYITSSIDSLSYNIDILIELQEYNDWDY